MTRAGLAGILLLVAIGCGADGGREPGETADATAPGEVSTDGGRADAAPGTPDGDGAARTEGEVAAPERCPGPFEPGPTPTGFADQCPVTGIDERTLEEVPPLGALDLAVQGSGDLALAGGTAEAVRLRRLRELEPSGPWSWPAPERRGALRAVTMSDGGYAVVWGDAEGVHLARPRGEPALVAESGRPEGVVAREGGTRVLVRGPDRLVLVTTDAQGRPTHTHPVNDAAKVDRVWIHAEGDNVVMPFTGPEPVQPLSYQTSSVDGGQCSLPAPFDARAGRHATIHATDLAFGYALFAWTVAGPSGCAPHHRIQIRGLPELALAAESSVPFGRGVELVHAGGKAAVLTARGEGAGTGWRLEAQFLELDADPPVPGGTRTGFEVSDAPPPSSWAAGRARGRYVVAWQPAGEGGLRLRRFCF